jgi:hypothetical protein
MAICGCSLPARCCQPAIAGGFIYADLRVSLALIWPHRLSLLRVFLPPPLSLAFPLLVAGCTPLLQQARVVYLQFCEGFPSSPLWRSGRPTFFATCHYCSYCLLLSFSFFSLGKGRSVQEAMLIWPRVVFGSTTTA